MTCPQLLYHFPLNHLPDISQLDPSIRPKRLLEPPIPRFWRWNPHHAGRSPLIFARSGEAGSGLYRIEVTCVPGSGVKVLNQATPPSFRESIKIGEQNLYSGSKELVGDLFAENPRRIYYTQALFSLRIMALIGGARLASAQLW